jgi:hypothetical protein
MITRYNNFRYSFEQSLSNLSGIMDDVCVTCIERINLYTKPSYDR